MNIGCMIRIKHKRGQIEKKDGKNKQKMKKDKCHQREEKK